MCVMTDRVAVNYWLGCLSGRLADKNRRRPLSLFQTDKAEDKPRMDSYNLHFNANRGGVSRKMTRSGPLRASPGPVFRFVAAEYQTLRNVVFGRKRWYCCSGSSSLAWWMLYNQPRCVWGLTTKLAIKFLIELLQAFCLYRALYDRFVKLLSDTFLFQCDLDHLLISDFKAIS